MRDPRHNPFPGMNPYTESTWDGVHNALIAYLCDALDDVLPAGLVPETDERVYVESIDDAGRQFRPDVHVTESPTPVVRPTRDTASVGGVAAAPVLIEVPDVEVRESFVTIVDVRTGGRVVTTVEVISPSNKVAGDGRRLYLRKQKDAIRARVSLVEIDLLRSGKPVTRARPSRVATRLRTPYHAVTARAGAESRLEYYPMPIRQPLPPIAIPLRPTDADVTIPLQPLFDRAYVKRRFADRINYSVPPDPPLAADDEAWADGVLRAAGLR